jgi:flagellar biosynthesis protein FliP
MRRLAVTLTALIIAMIAITYYGVQAETLTVQIETSIRQALAQISTQTLTLMVIVALVAAILLKLLTVFTRRGVYKGYL